MRSATRIRATFVCAVVGLLSAAPAVALAGSLSQAAQALRSGTVYVDPAAEATLSP